MISLAIIVFGTWLIISFVTFNTEYKSKVHHGYSESRTKTNWNAIALILNVYDYIIGVNWKDIFYPKSGIDKEIAEEEKEIAELERQKEKIDRRAELRRRKEILFKEVHEGGEWTDEDEIYHCYRCDSFIVGLDNFYKHHKEWHK